MPGFQRYSAFVKAHREANPEINNKEIQIRAAQALWKDVKNYPERQQQMIFEFRTKTANHERKLMTYWNKALKTVPAKGQLILEANCQALNYAVNHAVNSSKKRNSE